MSSRTNRGQRPTVRHKHSTSRHSTTSNDAKLRSPSVNASRSRTIQHQQQLKTNANGSCSCSNSSNTSNSSNNNIPKNENSDQSDKVTYCKTTNRELKIVNIESEYLVEISQAREAREANILENFDPNSEILDLGYRIQKLVGSGSYAHVFKAIDIQNSGRVCALKLIELSKCSKHYRDKFLRNEIHVIRMLSNVNVVTFYSAFNIQKMKAYAMVMEFVDNGTFADLVNNGPLPEDNSRKLFAGVANGLSYMHNSSKQTDRVMIAHRDLKLENLLLTADRVPRISDFSLSLIWDGKPCNDFCGTPPYFAPEILQKQPYNPLLYDVWSVGVCLYVMLNDAIPFWCIDDKLMLQKQLKREWKFRTNIESQLSSNVKNLLKLMLEPDPSKRYSMNDVLAHPWIRPGGSSSTLLTHSNNKQCNDNNNKKCINNTIINNNENK